MCPACPTGATYQRSDGIVVVDEKNISDVDIVNMPAHITRGSVTHLIEWLNVRSSNWIAVHVYLATGIPEISL